MYSGKDVNDCTPEETDAGRCWQIKPAKLATNESNLNEQSLLRAYGKRKCKKCYEKVSLKLTNIFFKSSGLRLATKYLQMRTLSERISFSHLLPH